MGSICKVVAASIEDLAIYLGMPAGSISMPPTDQDEDWSLEPELLGLILALVAANRPHTVVEVGTYRGRTAAAISASLEANRYGRVYTIDNGPEDDATAATDALCGVRGNRAVQVRASSVDAFREWGRAEIDLLLIDGGHDYGTAATDIALWSRLLAPTGWMIIHDTVTRLLRSFPEDYLFPLDTYDVIDVVAVHDRPSGHEWEGAAIVRFAEPGSVKRRVTHSVIEVGAVST